MLINTCHTMYTQYFITSVTIDHAITEPLLDSLYLVQKSAFFTPHSFICQNTFRLIYTIRTTQIVRNTLC